MRKRVLVTGASGRIGTIVMEDLRDELDLVPVSRSRLPYPGAVSMDVAREPERLRELMKDADAVVHLAYVEEETATTDNLLMAKAVYDAAFEVPSRPRVVMASSIHALGGHVDWRRFPYDRVAERDETVLELLSSYRLGPRHRRLPNGLYGALKCYIEVLGEWYASRGLEVVVIRFGGVRPDDRIPDEIGYHAFFLSRRDCAQIVKRAVEASLPTKYVCVFAVSDNKFRIHDIETARALLGYEPQDGA